MKMNSACTYWVNTCSSFLMDRCTESNITPNMLGPIRYREIWPLWLTPLLWVLVFLAWKNNACIARKMGTQPISSRPVSRSSFFVSDQKVKNELKTLWLNPNPMQVVASEYLFYSYAFRCFKTYFHSLWFWFVQCEVRNAERFLYKFKIAWHFTYFTCCFTEWGRNVTFSE